MTMALLRIFFETFFAGICFYAALCLPLYDSDRVRFRIMSILFFWIGLFLYAYSIRHLAHLGLVFHRRFGMNMASIYEIMVIIMLAWGIFFSFFSIVAAFSLEKWRFSIELGKLFFLFWCATTIIGFIAWLQTYYHAHLIPPPPR